MFLLALSLPGKRLLLSSFPPRRLRGGRRERVWILLFCPLLASDKPSPKKKKKSSPNPSSTGATSKKSALVGPASIKPSAKKKASSSDAASCNKLASSVKPSRKKPVSVDCSSSSLVTTLTKSVALGETSPPSASSSSAAAHSNDTAVSIFF